jgi:hypothetical protein
LQPENHVTAKVGNLDLKGVPYRNRFPDDQQAIIDWRNHHGLDGGGHRPGFRPAVAAERGW